MTRYLDLRIYCLFADSLLAQAKDVLDAKFQCQRLCILPIIDFFFKSLTCVLNFTGCL